MTVSEIFTVIMHGDELKILMDEIKLLREQLKKQEEDFEFYRAEGALYGTKFWIQPKEKEMNIEEALDSAWRSRNSSPTCRALYDEVKRLREVVEVKKGDLRGLKDEIQCALSEYNDC